MGIGLCPRRRGANLRVCVVGIFSCQAEELPVVCMLDVYGNGEKGNCDFIWDPKTF